MHRVRGGGRRALLAAALALLAVGLSVAVVQAPAPAAPAGGGFSDRGNWSSYFCGEGVPFGTADVDGDGRADLWCHSNGNTRIALSTGAGFSDRGNWSSYFCGGATPFGMADVDGDGRADSWCHSNGNTRVALSTGKGFSDRGNWSSYFCGANQFGTADVNGDGRSDVWCHFNGNTEVALSTGKGFEKRGIWSSYFCGKGQFGTADVNGDNPADLWCHSNGNTRIAVALGTPKATTPTRPTASVSSVSVTRTGNLAAVGTVADVNYPTGLNRLGRTAALTFRINRGPVSIIYPASRLGVLPGDKYRFVLVSSLPASLRLQKGYNLIEVTAVGVNTVGKNDGLDRNLTPLFLHCTGKATGCSQRTPHTDRPADSAFGKITVLGTDKDKKTVIQGWAFDRSRVGPLTVDIEENSWPFSKDQDANEWRPEKTVTADIWRPDVGGFAFSYRDSDAALYEIGASPDAFRAKVRGVDATGRAQGAPVALSGTLYGACGSDDRCGQVSRDEAADIYNQVRLREIAGEQGWFANDIILFPRSTFPALTTGGDFIYVETTGGAAAVVDPTPAAPESQVSTPEINLGTVVTDVGASYAYLGEPLLLALQTSPSGCNVTETCSFYFNKSETKALVIATKSTINFANGAILTSLFGVAGGAAATAIGVLLEVTENRVIGDRCLAARVEYAPGSRIPSVAVALYRDSRCR